MAKKIYIQAKKDIEALLQENGDSEICAGIPEYSSVWKEAFNDERVDEGESIVDFKYTEKALEIQKALNHGIDAAVVVAESINTPDFFDYLLGEVTIEGNYKTYTKPHVASDKKYFNFSQKNKKKYFTDKLLLALVNIAPKGSQAFKARNECKELMVLSFGGIPADSNVQACVMDCKHINNFKNLEKLKIYNPKTLVNSPELKKLKKLNDVSIEGNRVAHWWKVGNYELLISEDLPVLENLKSLHIEKATNKDLSFLENIKGIQNISLRHCSNLESLTGLDVPEVLDLDIFNCNQLTDTSILNKAVKVKNVMLSSEIVGISDEADTLLDISFVESFGLAESLNITGCDFSNLKDVSALQNLKRLSISNPKNLTVFPLLGENKNLNDLSIKDPNLTDLKGIGQCTNLKTISLSNNKNLNTVESLENIKFVDIGLNRSGIKNLDFLENIQIISSFNHSIGYNEASDIHEGSFSVSSNRSDEDKKKTGKGLPDGFDTNGHVIPEFYEDGSSSDFINYNTFYLNDCPNLEQIKGLKNVTNIMALDFRNCVKLTSLDGLEKMLDLREIDLTDCTSLESIHALKNCTKLEKILAFRCNKLSPKPKVKNMDTLEKVQEYLAKL
ncbi:leucine-rich repeat protein [Flavobacteriaceae bacterium]|nr:leucine-rich repeat protein [Flavobacteriaceae bacterium]